MSQDRIAHVSVEDETGATTTLTYPVPPSASNESIYDLIGIGIDAHSNAHGEDRNEITVVARLVENRP